jgi:putative DNA methylase
MSHSIISPKKLIEVALPLDAINVASAREKSIRHGHPSTLHLWWARRPLAAARAVIFSQLVNDPEDLWRCQNPGTDPNPQIKGHWTKTRAKLFSIIEDLVKWENTTNDSILAKAHDEIRRSWCEICDLNKDHPQAAELFNPDRMPGLHDPFAGGGTIPLEAQRLGLQAYASDLNPVAVLINKAMIELPPKFVGRPPVNSNVRETNPLGMRQWRGAEGLAEDVRFYGNWMREQAEKQIGKLYPKVKVSQEMASDRPDLEPYAGNELTVIAWLWVRTVKSPNPAFSDVHVPLCPTYMLSTKKGGETYLEVIKNDRDWEFVVRVGKPPDKALADRGSKSAAGRGSFVCVMSNSPISVTYIRQEAQAGRMGTRLMAVVGEGQRGRVYLSPSHCDSEYLKDVAPEWKPDLKLHGKVAVNVPLYGMKTFSDLFTDRQLLTLSVLSKLSLEAGALARADAIAAGIVDDGSGLESSGSNATAYGEAVSTYLSFAVSKALTRNCTQTVWYRDRDSTMAGFSRQAIAMSWDFAEVNPLLDGTGSIAATASWVAEVLESSLITGGSSGKVWQQDARTVESMNKCIISTDPPYYDNICYADLSDFFYVWLRNSLRGVFPTLFATLATPKSDELIASTHMHKSREASEAFFLDGMTKALTRMLENTHPAFPVTIYYAFKQSETKATETASTGWETFLTAVIESGFQVHGTWPMRTEQPHGLRVIDTNALASSILLVCKKRDVEARAVSRREFIRELNATLPLALDAMTRESEGLHSPVAPVDLSQAIIGPGMAVFSRYAAVLEADGTPMTIRTALQLINRFLAEDDFDSDTQFCLHWFEQYGWETGKFGEADTLARAKGTSVDGVKQAGVLHATGGNVRLLKWAEYPPKWDPKSDQRLPIWEALHQLIRVFNTDGETGAASVFAAVQSKAEAARQLAYRLYTLCERKNWAEDARAYNEVVTSWSSIESAAAKEPAAIQRTLFDN